MMNNDHPCDIFRFYVHYFRFTAQFATASSNIKMNYICVFSLSTGRIQLVLILLGYYIIHMFI